MILSKNRGPSFSKNIKKEKISSLKSQKIENKLTRIGYS